MKATKIQQKYDTFVAYFEEQMPMAESELHYKDPYQLLVAVILSAQCTDKRVNMTTPALFQRFPTAQDMAAATVEEIHSYIKSISYPNNKAKNLLGMAQTLVSDFGGVVPDNLEDMQKLPGVGRKTANVIRGNVFREPSVVVDTHVGRLARRLGLTEEEDPEKVEYALMKAIPKDHWIAINTQLIALGRTICKSQRPKCEECFLKDICKHYKKL